MGNDEARGDRIEGKAELLPDFECVPHEVRGVLNFKFPVVQCIRYQCRRQIVGDMAHVRQDRHHRRQCHFAVAGKIIDKKNLFSHLRPSFLRHRGCDLHSIVT